MALNLKSSEVEQLVDRVVSMTGESKTEAIRRALAERRDRLVLGSRRSRSERLRAFLEEEAWPMAPVSELGRAWSRDEWEQALGLEEPR